MPVFLFSEYSQAFSNDEPARKRFGALIQHNEEILAERHRNIKNDKRANDSRYFPMYFTPAIPDNIYSHSTLERFVFSISKTDTSQTDVSSIFAAELFATRANPERQLSFLQGLMENVSQLDFATAEKLALAAAISADLYTCEPPQSLLIRDAALGIILRAATARPAPDAKHLLKSAMEVATHDSFARMLLDQHEKILPDESILSETARESLSDEAKSWFLKRMRTRYGSDSPPVTDLTCADSYAFFIWVKSSNHMGKVF